MFTKICRKQAEIIQTHDNANVRNIGKNEAQQRKYKRLKLGGGQAYCRKYIPLAYMLHNARTDRLDMYI
jgi:hypothetical protein